MKPLVSRQPRSLAFKAAAFAVALASCQSPLSPPSGPLSGLAEERAPILARLIAMEDARWYQPLLAGRASGSPDPFIRARTALSLGRLAEPEAAIYLPVLLSDRTPEVRRDAAFACGLSSDPRLVSFLIRALDDSDVDVRQRSALALGRFSSPEAGEALLAAASRPAPVPSAALALFRPAFSAKSGPLLVDLAAGQEGDLKKAALYALFRRPHPALTGEIVSAGLASTDDEVAAWAARAAGIRKESGVIRELISLLDRPSASVRIQALGALERIGAHVSLPESLVPAALVLTSDEHPGVALSAIRLLGRLGSSEAVRNRLDEILGRGGRRGAAALTAIAFSAPERAMRLLHEGGLSPDVRLGAAEALPGLDSSDRLRLGSLLLLDPAARVRGATLGSVPAVSFPNAEDLAVRLLSDADLAVQASALEWSTEMRAALPDSELAKSWEAAAARALASSESDFQVTAVDAVANLGEPARLRLESLANSPDPVVRQRALARLKEKWGREAVKGRLQPVQTERPASDYVRMARLALAEKPRVRVQTDAGEFEMSLDAGLAPLTVDAFLKLSRARFFDGLSFHRVVPDFVVQGGDPRGDGSGGPGFTIRDELSPVEFKRGTVGIALSGPDTGGSQWFVTLSRHPHLDGGFTAFAEVVRGMETLDKTEQGMRIRRIESVP